MSKIFPLSILILFIIESLNAEKSEYAVLLHGLARTGKSMKKIEKALTRKNYSVLNIDYKSRKDKIENIAANEVAPAIDSFYIHRDRKIHFVTHSMGGIVLRYYLTQKRDSLNLGRIVMLSPPNKGSEVVDFLRKSKAVKKIMGPAFVQLSTDSGSFVNTLPEIACEVGVITGSKSINFINSAIIPGEDDGKVSVESAKLKEMKDFLVVKRMHFSIMNAKDVIGQTMFFLKEGRFKP